MIISNNYCVYLSLGSNLGDRKENLEKALELLSHRLRVKSISSLYETEPVGNQMQPKFLNIAVKAETTLEPAGLLLLLKGIERKMGRLPGPKNSPRTIDIDIILFDKSIVKTPNLTIPHPRFSERAFVLVPLQEIEPDAIDPVSRKSISQLGRELDKKGLEGVNKLTYEVITENVSGYN